jgi:hypothetical protein
MNFKKVILSLAFLSALATQQAKADDVWSRDICEPLEGGRVRITFSSNNDSDDLGRLLTNVVVAAADNQGRFESGIYRSSDTPYSKIDYVAKDGAWTATRHLFGAYDNSVSMNNGGTITGEGACQNTQAGYVISGPLAGELSEFAAKANLTLQKTESGQVLLVPNWH